MLNLSTLSDERTKAVKEASEIIGEVVKVSNDVRVFLRSWLAYMILDKSNKWQMRLQKSYNLCQLMLIKILYIAHIYETE